MQSSDQFSASIGSGGGTAPVTQRALERIQAMLGSGAYPSGSQLPPQRQLAAELGVSRASLREALSILGTLGVLRSEHGRGTFVAGSEPAGDGGDLPDWRFAARVSPLEVYQFRLVVEPRAAALAALHVGDGQIARLEALNRRFEQATRELDLVGCAEIDFEIHEQIMHQAGNRLLRELYHGYRAVLLESQRLPLAKRSRLLEPVGEHERLIEALRMHDPEGAGYYMRVHIGRAADRVGLEVVDVG